MRVDGAGNLNRTRSSEGLESKQEVFNPRDLAIKVGLIIRLESVWFEIEWWVGWG